MPGRGGTRVRLRARCARREREAYTRLDCSVESRSLSLCILSSTEKLLFQVCCQFVSAPPTTKSARGTYMVVAAFMLKRTQRI